MMSVRNYVSIVLLFAVIFVMFMCVTISYDKLADGSAEQTETDTAVHMDNLMLDSTFDESVGRPVQPISGNSLLSVKDNPQAAIVVSDPDDNMTSVLTEWCIYNKYRYQIFTTLPDSKVLSQYNTMLFGNLEITDRDLSTLQQCAKTGIPMIFTRLPAYAKLMENPDLADFFGIKSCVQPSKQLDGVKIFGDFFLSKERVYTYHDEYGEQDDMAIKIPYYTLRAGYEVYAVAVLDQQGEISNEELPALLWRTYTGSSQVFVINSDIFYGEKLLGVITAFMSQTSSCYLYPVVNAQSIVVLDYPCFSNENSSVMMDRYSRSTQGFGRDVLWPTISKILKNYGDSYNFFITPQLDYSNTEPLYDDVEMYRKEINKLSGATGLSLQQVTSQTLPDVLAQDETFFQAVHPSYHFTALYSGAFSDSELSSFLDPRQDGLLSHVKLVLSDFEEDRRLFRFINNDVLSVMTTMNGFQHESMDDIQMLSLETALGMCTQQADMSRVLYPQGDQDDWIKLSRLWSEGKTYYNDYETFEDTSVYQLEARVKNFLALNYNYQRTDNTIKVSIDNFNGAAWFVLRIHNMQVKNVTNGSAAQLTDTAYLIKAEKANVTIQLQETNFLHPPG